MDEFRTLYAKYPEKVVHVVENVENVRVHRAADGSFDVDLDLTWRRRTRDGATQAGQDHERWSVVVGMDGVLCIRSMEVHPRH